MKAVNYLRHSYLILRSAWQNKVLTRNAGIIHFAIFWLRNNGLQCAYFVNNGPKCALMKRRFWIPYIKWYKFYSNNLSVVLESKQRERLKLVNPKHEDWASIQLLILSPLTFLFTLRRCQVIFQWKQANEKLGNALIAWRNFRVGLRNG